MLSSITPLGERGRNTRWSRTATAYVIGSVLAAVLVGAALGALGSLVPAEVRGSPWVLGALALALLAGLVLDVRSQGHGVPSWRRQVDREWIGRYRGWVTGLGFGVQLGLGFATIITSTTTYAVFAAQLLTGSWWAGALIGAVFGLVRALPLLAVRRAHTPQALHDAFATVDRWAPGADKVARASSFAGAMVLVGAIVI